MALPAGSKLGPYEILAQIGARGMGEVYRARDTRLGRDVALKILPEDASREPEVLRAGPPFGFKPRRPRQLLYLSVRFAFQVKLNLSWKMV